MSRNQSLAVVIAVMAIACDGDSDDLGRERQESGEAAAAAAGGKQDSIDDTVICLDLHVLAPAAGCDVSWWTGCEYWVECGYQVENDIVELTDEYIDPGDHWTTVARNLEVPQQAIDGRFEVNLTCEMLEMDAKNHDEIMLGGVAVQALDIVPGRTTERILVARDGGKLRARFIRRSSCD